MHSRIQKYIVKSVVYRIYLQILIYDTKTVFCDSLEAPPSGGSNDPQQSISGPFIRKNIAIFHHKNAI